MFFGENPGKRGTMVKKIHKKMRTAVFGMVLCAFLGACGEKEELVLLPSQESIHGELGCFADTASGQTDTSEQQDTSEKQDEVFEQSDTASKQLDAENGAGTTEAGSTKASIFVHVCGAVARPGVVELPEGSRADDALHAAGGFLEDAARDFVNLAARVEDGQKLYFPAKEEAEELMAAAKTSQQAETAKEDGTVNINTADKEKLCTLPGIGESRAEDIIAYREKNGGFGRIEEIMNVPGIKEGAYDKLKARIRTE